MLVYSCNMAATSGIYFGSLKRFLLFAELGNNQIHTSHYHFGDSDLKTQGESLFYFMYVTRSYVCDTL